MKDLKDRIVLITGAASGIGLALAHAFTAEGSRVVVVDINEVGCRTAAAGLAGACAYRLDVTDAEAALALAETVESEVGPVDILVNCAGIAFLGEVVDTALEDWRRILDVNLMGPVNLIHAFLPRMYERRSGHVVNIASGAGLFPLPGLGAYVATKYALVGLSETLYIEARSRGVAVTAICPWGVLTPIVEGAQVYGYDESRGERTIRMIKPFLKSPEHVATRIIRAVRKDQPVYMHTAMGKYIDFMHRMSRRLHLAGVSLLYEQGLRRLLSGKQGQ
jgi:NAD(P)-dependent dehydrogenase (short-subunit alcohol dehydrogenase family)